MRLRDLTGQRFGRLTVIERAPNNPRSGARWRCMCDCGNYKEVSSQQLVSGMTVSCGCYRKELNTTRCLKDIAGQRFGKLVALERAAPPRGRSGKRAWWKCQCDCGNITVCDGAELRNGTVKSCGCAKHLASGEAAFNALWYVYRTAHQRKRGLSPGDPKAQFTLTKEQFRELTKQNCFYCGKLPSTVKKAKHSDYLYNGLDRIDNTKGYTPDNVVPCCGECNFHKGSLPQDQFLAWLDRVTAFGSS